MSTNGTPIKHVTTCALCQQRFANSALPVIGESPDAGTVRFITALTDHLKRVHPQEIETLKAAGVTMSRKFIGWMVLRNFQTADPNLQRSQEELRQWLHGLTRRAQLTDADITQKVIEIENAGPLTAEAVTALCKEIRDLLTEQGRYASPSVLITT